MSKESNNSEHSRVKVNKGLVGLMALTMMATGCAPVIGATPTKEEEPTNSSSVGNIGPEEKEDSINAPIYELPRRVPGAGEERFFPPVNTPEPTATATEIPLIQGDIFFDPQSKEDFKNVALAPSPIDEPEKFALWHEEYFKQINEKLENYNGPTVEVTHENSNGTYGNISYYSEKWPVAGSYLFKWHGEDVLNKTYIFDKKSDGDGYVLLNTTYYPESIMKDKSYEYNYGTVKEVLSIIYTLTDTSRESNPNVFSIDFFNAYPRTLEQIDSLNGVYINKPKEGDEAVFSQMQFICAFSK